jgi:hypothetical protein
MKQVIVVTGASSGLALSQRARWLMRDTLHMPACVTQRAATLPR